MISRWVVSVRSEAEEDVRKSVAAVAERGRAGVLNRMVRPSFWMQAARRARGGTSRSRLNPGRYQCQMECSYEAFG